MHLYKYITFTFVPGCRNQGNTTVKFEQAICNKNYMIIIMTLSLHCYPLHVLRFRMVLVRLWCQLICFSTHALYAKCQNLCYADVCNYHLILFWYAIICSLYICIITFIVYMHYNVHCIYFFILFMSIQ
jgi:hypothetical protein